MPESGKQRKGFFHEIIEVGIVCVQNQVIVDTFTSFVKPEVNPVLNERCKNFLDISQEDVNAGIRFTKLVERLNHYKSFDSNTVVT